MGKITATLFAISAIGMFIAYLKGDVLIVTILGVMVIVNLILNLEVRKNGSS